MSVHMIEGQLPGGDEDLRSDFQMLRDSVDNLRQMLMVLTDFAQVAEGDVGVAADRFDARRMVEEVVEEVRRDAATGSPIRLVVEESCPGTVELDPRLVWQALRYALVNAVVSSEGAEVGVRAYGDGGRWVVAVRDPSPPLEPAEYDLTDQPMQRLMSTRRERRGGDLAIVACIARKLGGSVRLVARREEEATELVVEFPTRLRG